MPAPAARRTTEAVVDYLRQKMLDGELHPGDREIRI